MRLRDPKTLPTISAAALSVFARRGFARAQMSEVAEEAGVSVGTLYNHVENKEALLVMSVLGAFDDLAAEDLPYSVPDRSTALRRLQAVVRRRVNIEALDGAGSTGPASPDEVAVVVGELFDLLAETRQVADVFERCAADAPDLAAVFYLDARGRLLDQLTTFLEVRVLVGDSAGSVPAALVARQVIETATWLARHRHHDPTLDLDDEEARRVAVELSVRLLTGARP